MATIIKAVTFPWEGVPMRCRECGSVMSFDADDLGDMLYPMQKWRASLHYGWEVRGTCRVCHKPMAHFREVRDE
jgi:hypothetical protein